MSILSDEILESLICTQCKKYLSVKPVKVYHNRGIKCGRCSGPSDGGVNSLYGILAEDVLFRCVNRFEGCSQLLAYGDVVEHEKICNATRKYDCPVCTNPFEATGYELLIHFKENHPDRLLIGKAEFVLTIDYEESRTYLYRKNDLLFFIISNYDKNIKELTLNAKYLGASQEAAIIFQKFGLLSVDEKVVSKTRQKPCSSEQTLDNFKIALNEECFPKQVVLCKLELVTGPAEQIWVLPKSTSHKELQGHIYPKVEDLQFFRCTWETTMQYDQVDVDHVNNALMQTINGKIKFKDCSRLEDLEEKTELVICGIQELVYRHKTRFILQFENLKTMYCSNYWFEKELENGNVDLNYKLKIKLDKLKVTPSKHRERVVFCI